MFSWTKEQFVGVGKVSLDVGFGFEIGWVGCSEVAYSGAAMKRSPGFTVVVTSLSSPPRKNPARVYPLGSASVTMHSSAQPVGG